jgi:TetR/AcrR family transcriptional repressor of nem operon
MLAAEYETLPGAVQGEVRGFFDDQRAWLARVLGRDRRPTTGVRRRADMFLAGLEGALLIARTDGSIARFRRTARALVDAVV